MFNVLNDCVQSLTSCNQTLDSVLSLLEPIRIETAAYRDILDYSRDYDLATVRDIREVRKEVVKLLTVGNGKRLSESVEASIIALNDQEIELFGQVQQQELQLMNLRANKKKQPKAATPPPPPSSSSFSAPLERAPTAFDIDILKQLDSKSQNLRKLCEAEEQLTLEEYNQVALLKKENLEIERELEDIHLRTEEEQEKEQHKLIKELQALEQQIHEKQQQSQESMPLSTVNPTTAHLDTMDTIIKSIEANDNRASLSTIHLVEQYVAELQQSDIIPQPQAQNKTLTADNTYQLKTVLSDSGLKEKWLMSMKALCKQLMPDHIMGKTAGRLLEILVHQPNFTVSVDTLRKEFPPEREKRHQLSLVVLIQLEAKIIMMNEGYLSIKL